MTLARLKKSSVLEGVRLSPARLRASMFDVLLPNVVVEPMAELSKSGAAVPATVAASPTEPARAE